MKRDLVAAGYVDSFRRTVDPAKASPFVAGMLDDKIIGLKALRDAVLKDRTSFDDDTEIECLRVLDRYTIQ